MKVERILNKSLTRRREHKHDNDDDDDATWF
jgi:hypothetical protein